jgi:hypothetical protein
VKIALIFTFKKVMGLQESSQVSNFFQGRKNLILKLGNSQQFKNNQFSWPIFTSQISKNSKKKIGFFFRFFV